MSYFSCQRKQIFLHFANSQKGASVLYISSFWLNIQLHQCYNLLTRHIIRKWYLQTLLPRFLGYFATILSIILLIATSNMTIRFDSSESIMGLRPISTYLRRNLQMSWIHSLIKIIFYIHDEKVLPTIKIIAVIHLKSLFKRSFGYP